jgi:hypothetical protein
MGADMLWSEAMAVSRVVSFAGFTDLADDVRLLLAGSDADSGWDRAVGYRPKGRCLVGWEAMWLFAPSRAR